MSTIAITREADLVEAVCAARDGKRTLEIFGAGTKRGLGRPVEADDVLDLSGLSGITAYEPEELVLTAQAGTPLVEIEVAIAEKNQRLGFDPADWGPLFGAPAQAGTIGGALSADTSGSARVRYGAARDHLLGFRGVNGYGEAYKGGGRVVKNVTGFDISKLMCGGFGTLGPMSEVTLRLVPRAAKSLTLVLRDIAPEAGLRLLRGVWASPLEATGLAFISASAARPFGLISGIGAGAALMRVDGMAEALSEKRAALRKLCDGHDMQDLEDGDAAFARIGSGGAYVGHDADIWRIAVPPAASDDTAQALAGTMWLADWAGGLFWVGTSASNADTAAHLRQIAARARGHATLLRADEETRRALPVFPPQPQTLAALTRQVTSAFDPLGIFNPGRMGGGV